MEEVKVSFETAKHLKELGFDIECSDFYTDEGKLETYCSNKRNNSSLNFWDDMKPKYSAPTQGLVAKWLREIHSLHISITNNIGTFHYFGEVRPIDDAKFKLLNEKPLEVGISGITYEEILEKSLKKALELI